MHVFDLALSVSDLNITKKEIQTKKFKHCSYGQYLCKPFRTYPCYQPNEGAKPVWLGL